MRGAAQKIVGTNPVVTEPEGTEGAEMPPSVTHVVVMPRLQAQRRAARRHAATLRVATRRVAMRRLQAQRRAAMR